MKKTIRYVGLDVHSETIAVAVAEGSKRPATLGTIPNHPNSVRSLVKKLGSPATLRVCYEAGPCGYVLYWQLSKLGVKCEVIAPTLIPVRAGDRVKTDRRDAEKLAGLYRSGELTPVWIPDARHEALRDLVRARESAKADELRARHRLGKFLLRQGVRRPEGTKAWTSRHRLWLQTVAFEIVSHQDVFDDYLAEVDHAKARIERLENKIDRAIEDADPRLKIVIDALQAMRGVAKISAVTIVTEVGQMSRFDRPAKLMGYSGLVPSENSSGGRTSKGHITKTGNHHLRRILGEAAWSYRLRPNRGYVLRKRQEKTSQAVQEIAWKAQHRLHHRYAKLMARGKTQQKIVTAVARELLGFVWAIGVQAERELATRKAA